MTVFSTRELRAALEKKGFKRRNGHHTFYTLYVNGKKTSIRTKISHGSRDYGPNLLRQIGRQLRLSSRDLEDFVKCPLTEEVYIQKLLEEGKIRLTEDKASNS